MADRVNWLKNCLDAFWAVVQAEEKIVDIFGGKWVKKDMSDGKQLAHERAPFLAAWLGVPEVIWFAAGSMRGQIEINVLGVVVSGDREDYTNPTQAYVDLAGCLEEDLAKQDGSSILRNVGRVIGLEVMNPAFTYGRDTERDEGVYFISFSVRCNIDKRPSC